MEWGGSYTLNWGDENVHQWCYEESRVIFRGQLKWNTKQRCSLFRLLSRCVPSANWQNLPGTKDQIHLNTPIVSMSLSTTTAFSMIFPLVLLYQLWSMFRKMSPATQIKMFSLSHRIESLHSAKNSTTFLRLLSECWAKVRTGQSSDSLCWIWSPQRHAIFLQTRRLSLKNTFWICLKCFHYLVPQSIFLEVSAVALRAVTLTRISNEPSKLMMNAVHLQGWRSEWKWKQRKMVIYAHSDGGRSECKEIRKAYKEEKPNFGKQSNGCRMRFLCKMGNI